ncbi:MAG: SDR family NAD(P)-dependent oxidoreductase [Bacteroidales bacterium]|jgi:short-subunit dehydrogenase|nr:SDR family NAD(P)-dependent oxidoreductase [Bacteroidales bacterium]
MYKKGNRKGKTALVTGAASGIGYAFAEKLAQDGYDLLISDLQEEKTIEVADNLHNNYAIDVKYLILDLSRIDAAEIIYEFCCNKNIEIYILISNAGRFAFDSITDIETDKYDSILQLHMNTPAKLCRLFGKDMKKRRNGYILTVSSLSAWMPYPYLSLYSSTKRFLRTFSRSIHFEFSNYNVGVTTICPGAIDTDLYNLKPHLRKIARNLGIMMKPEILAERSLKKMQRKRVTYIPGLINKIAIPILLIIPVRIITFFTRKIAGDKFN